MLLHRDKKLIYFVVCMELKKANVMKKKLEELCRELQKQNKIAQVTTELSRV